MLVCHIVGKTTFHMILKLNFFSYMTYAECRNHLLEITC